MSAGDIPDPDDPVEYYINTMRLDGKSEKTIKRVQEMAEYFENYIDNENTTANSFADITPRDVKKIRKNIAEQSDRQDHIVKKGLSRVKSMYEYYSDRGAFDANPVKIAIDEINWNTSNDPSKREISISEMKSKIGEIAHPMLLAVVLLLAKTGIRSGELCNLDLRDVHIDHPVGERLLPEPRKEIADEPDTIFVPADIATGDVYNGEKRRMTNKRKRATKIPVDDELKQAIVWWVMSRPYYIDTNALFVRTSGGMIDLRHDGSSINKQMAKWTKQVGWRSSDDSSENVTPHYFRHFFTTNMRQRLNDSDIDGNDPKLFVKGIRGDKGSDVISVYTHQWGNYVRETYNKTIYSLL